MARVGCRSLLEVIYLRGSNRTPTPGLARFPMRRAMKPSSHDPTKHANPKPARSTVGRHAARPDAGTYVPPRLLVYGVVRDLTASGGRVGKNDKAVRHSRTGF